MSFAQAASTCFSKAAHKALGLMVTMTEAAAASLPAGCRALPDGFLATLRGRLAAVERLRDAAEPFHAARRQGAPC